MNLNHTVIYKGRTGLKPSRHGGYYYEELFVSKQHGVEVYTPIDQSNKNYNRIWRDFKKYAVVGDEYEVKLKKSGNSVHIDKYERVCANADNRPKPIITQFQKFFN